MVNMARIKKGKDGYYRTSLTIGGKRFPLVAKTLREIETKKAEIWNNYEKGNIIKTSNMTLQQYAENWFHSFQQNRNPNTRDMYYYSIFKHIIPAIGHIPINKITKSDIQAMIDEKAEHPATCHKIMNSCRQMFEDMIDDDLINSNPCRKGKIRMPKQTKQDVPPLSELELNAIINADLGEMERMFLNCLMAFGVRRAEALGLMKNDFDFENSILHLRRSIIFDKNTPIINQNMKTATSHRDMHIPSVFIGRFKQYVRSCPTLYLFTKKDGNIMTKSSYDKMWMRITKALNNYLLTESEQIMKQQPSRRITALTFRHDFATQLYYSDISRKKAVEMMGHAGTQMIESVYAALDAEKEKAEQKIDDLHMSRISRRSM